MTLIGLTGAARSASWSHPAPQGLSQLNRLNFRSYLWRPNGVTWGCHYLVIHFQHSRSSMSILVRSSLTVLWTISQLYLRRRCRLRCRIPVTNLVANLIIRFWLCTSDTRFGEQTSMLHPRCSALCYENRFWKTLSQILGVFLFSQLQCI